VGKLLGGYSVAEVLPLNHSTSLGYFARLFSLCTYNFVEREKERERPPSIYIAKKKKKKKKKNKEKKKEEREERDSFSLTG
jgi:hypothetical protein